MGIPLILFFTLIFVSFKLGTFIFDIKVPSLFSLLLLFIVLIFESLALLFKLIKSFEIFK